MSSIRTDDRRHFGRECQGSSLEHGREDAAVRDCPSAHTCSLYPYRLGRNPRHARASKRTIEKAGLSPENDSKTGANRAGG